MLFVLLKNIPLKTTKVYFLIKKKKTNPVDQWVCQILLIRVERERKMNARFQRSFLELANSRENVSLSGT